MRKKINKKENNIQDAFTLSISDLMAGLLAIFIFALSYLILNFNQATAQLTQNDVKRAALLEQIYQELEKNGVKVVIDEQHGVLRISEGVLFDLGKAEVKPKGKEVIKVLSIAINKTLTSEEFNGSVETVFIEGHTDNIPINNGEFPSNWELSTKRAINTWLTMGEIEPQLIQLKNNNGQQIFSCSGYADTRPISDNSIEEGRQNNRRIDIRFSMSTPSEEDMNIVKFVRGKMNNND